MNGRGLAGVRFVPVRFTPKASVYKGEECGGVNFVVTDRARLRPVRLGLELAVALRRLHPNDWKVDSVQRLLVNADVLERIKRGDEPEAVEAAWQPRLNEFRRARARALLYK
jgi:uncharacterized protein YbbC (DUF1343 family)